jgi:hypothetical protein
MGKMQYITAQCGKQNLICMCNIIGSKMYETDFPEVRQTI